MANDRFTVVGTNIAEKAAMIWNVADMLRGPFKPHEYGLVILPMTVVKRFHDCLLPTHDAVMKEYESKKNFAVIDGFLTKASGYQFYNTSKYTFDLLCADPDNIEANFRDYLAGFSANVQDVLAKFDFNAIINRMVESNTLYLVIKEFNSQKLQLEYYKLQKTFEGAIQLENLDGEYVPAKQKAVGGQKKKSTLDEILEKVNEKFKGDFTDADRVMISALHDKLMKNQKLKNSAGTTDPVIFTESIFPQAFGDAAMESYTESEESYASLFSDKSKYNAIMSVLAGVIYREMRKPGERQ